MKPTRLEVLEAEIEERVKERDTIISKQIDEKLAPLIGRCFKMRNNYSCPKKASDYWWEYARVDYHEGRTCCGRAFSTDSDGRFTFDPEHWFYPANEGSEWIEISVAEFMHELVKQQTAAIALAMTPAEPKKPAEKTA